MQVEQGEVHPIACENCRNKKSKCGREIPICSQCSALGTFCRYPSINKRGIPSGYISVIEKRLLETELVLFELLSTIYNSQIPIEPYRSTESQRQAIAAFNLKQSKNEKIDDWKRSPLATDAQRYEWWLERCNLMQTETNENTVLLSNAPQHQEEVERALTPPSDAMIPQQHQAMVDASLEWQPVAASPEIEGLAHEEQWRKYF